LDKHTIPPHLKVICQRSYNISKNRDQQIVPGKSVRYRYLVGPYLRRPSMTLFSVSWWMM